MSYKKEMSQIAQLDLEHAIKQWHKVHSPELGAVEILIVPDKCKTLQIKISETKLMSYEEMVDRLRAEGRL